MHADFVDRHRCIRWNRKGFDCPFRLKHGEPEGDEGPDDLPTPPVLPPIGAVRPTPPLAEPVGVLAPAREPVQVDKPVQLPPVEVPFPVLPPPPPLVPVPVPLIPRIEVEIERLMAKAPVGLFAPVDPKGEGVAAEQRPFRAFWAEAVEEAVARTVSIESPANADVVTEPRRAKRHPIGRGGATGRPIGTRTSPGQGRRAGGQPRVFDASEQFELLR